MTYYIYNFYNHLFAILHKICYTTIIYTLEVPLMTITNNTSVTLEILGNRLAPQTSQEFTERAFNTLDIHSEIGSCTITTEYSQRSIRNFGKLVASEGSERNERGMLNIIVSSIG